MHLVTSVCLQPDDQSNCDSIVPQFCTALIRLNAVESMDFNVLGTPLVVFSALMTSSGDQQCVNISITDDMMVEGQQLIEVQLDAENVAPMGQIDFNSSTSLITVWDNDGNVDDVGHDSYIYIKVF